MVDATRPDMLTANRSICTCQHMNDKRTDVLYGSLGLIILKTLEALGRFMDIA